MSRAARATTLLLSLLLSAVAWGQEGADIATGEGTIRGRLVRSSGSGAANAEVALYGLTTTGDAGLRRTRSDADGRFEFAGIAVDEMVYLVGARVDDIPFGSRVTFEPGQTLREIEIEVHDTSRDAGAVTAGPLQIRLAQGCTHLRAWHTHSLRNDTPNVIFVPEAERAGAEPLATTRLPAGAVGFELPMGAQGVEQEAGVVRFWGPLYPGEQDLEFGYGLPLGTDAVELGTDAVELDIQATPGASRIGIAVPPGHGVPSATGLESRGSVDFEGLRHDGYLAPALGAEDTFALRMPLAKVPGGDLEFPRSRLLLEMDDVALRVDEIHRVRSETPRASSGLPLACLPTPKDALDLRFSGEARAMGLARDPSGVIAIHGPIRAGESGLAFSYQLASPGDDLPFARRFGVPIEVFDLIVADTGIVPQTTRLHRRRPIRDQDRNYLALEAFAVQPDETIAITLHRLSSAGGVTPALAAGLIALAGLGALGYLLAPLRREDDPEKASESGTAMARQAIYKTIDDLDEDLATGKLSPEDHERMRGELKAEAVELLRREREAPRSQPPVKTHCPSCNTRVRAGDRFCSACGASLGPGPESDERESAA